MYFIKVNRCDFSTSYYHLFYFCILFICAIMMFSCNHTKENVVNVNNLDDTLSIAKFEKEFAAMYDSVKTDVEIYVFVNRFAQFIDDCPASFKYSFPVLKDRSCLEITESNDHRIKIYRLYDIISEDGIHSVMQYVDDEGNVHLAKINHPHWESLCLKDEIKRRDETVYVVCQEDDGLKYQKYQLYGLTIKGKELVGVPLFDKGNGEIADHFNYRVENYFTDSDKEFFRYNDKDHQIEAVVINPAFPYKEKEILCKYDGKKFDCTNSLLYQWYHPSLRGFESVEDFFVTKDYVIWVDSIKDEGYRYVSWKRPAKLTDEPSLKINNGEYDEDEIEYIFENEGYTYLIGFEAFDWIIKKTITVIKDEQKIVHQVDIN